MFNLKSTAVQILRTLNNYKTMSTIKDAKIELRKKISEKLLNLSIEDKRKQSEEVIKKLFELKSFQNSKRISVYLSTENEINTKPIVEKIFENNQHCFIPRYCKKKMEMVKLYSMEDWENLPLTKWNIKQPKLNEKRENALETGGLDLLIIPGVAFTKDGKRLGHGGGYYDKFLKEIKQSQEKNITTIALAFQEQCVEDLPCQEHDEIIDIVLFL